MVAVQRRPILVFDNVFFINKSLWNKSGPMTQEALIDHEITYLLALIKGAHNSKKVREFISFILSDSYLESSKDEVSKMFFTKILNYSWYNNKLGERELDRHISKLCQELKKDYYFTCRLD